MGRKMLCLVAAGHELQAGKVPASLPQCPACPARRPSSPTPLHPAPPTPAGCSTAGCACQPTATCPACATASTARPSLVGGCAGFVRWPRQRVCKGTFPPACQCCNLPAALASSMHSLVPNLDLPHLSVPGFAGEFTDADLARLERCLPSSIFYKEPDAQARRQGRHTGGVYGPRGCAGGVRA